MRVAYSDTEVTGLDFVFLDSMRTESFGIASSYLKEFAFSYENRLLGFFGMQIEGGKIISLGAIHTNCKLA